MRPASVVRSAAIRPSGPTSGASAQTKGSSRDDIATRIGGAPLTPLTFPTSSQVALRVVEAINAPSCQLETAARIVQLEPLLAAKVVALSNSALYNRSGRENTSVQYAVQLIGLQMLKTLAISLVVRQMAAGARSGRGPVASRLWDHSMHVAALAYVIAKRVTGQPPEAAMFAGIIHELSGFCLMSVSKDVLGMDDDELAHQLSSNQRRDAFDAAWTSEGLAQRVGRPLLHAMRIPQTIIDAVATTWRGELVLPPQTLGDTLMLAETLAPVRSPFEDAHLADKADRAELDGVIDDDLLIELLEESEQILSSLCGALGS